MAFIFSLVSAFYYKLLFLIIFVSIFFVITTMTISCTWSISKHQQGFLLVLARHLYFHSSIWPLLLFLNMLTRENMRCRSCSLRSPIFTLLHFYRIYLPLLLEKQARMHQSPLKVINLLPIELILLLSLF